MMKPIDKQVLDTMQQLDQPYSSAYWDNALSHIEGMEKRRRRVIGFWWILAGIILISAGSLIWWTAVENKGKPNNSTEKQLAGLTQGEHSNINEGEEKVIENEIVKKDNDLIPNENNSAQIKKIDPVIRKNRTAQKNIHKSEAEDKLIQKRVDSGIENVALQSSDEKNITALMPKETLINKSSVEPGRVEEEVSILPALTISPFDTEFMWRFEKPEFKSYAVVLPIKWHLNMLSELSILTNVPGRKDEKAILGAQAGIGLRLKSGNGFFTGITAGYAIRTGTFGNMLDHPTPEYVFEKKEEGFRLIPTTLSYAHSQMHAGWERGSWSGRAGIQAMYLVGATGELYNYSIEASAQDPGVIISRVSKVSEGSISTPAFRKWVVELQAGLEFAISQRWKVTGQFAYTPSGLSYPLVENIYDPIEGRYETTEGASILKEQFLHIQLGIQYQW